MVLLNFGCIFRIICGIKNKPPPPKLGPKPEADHLSYESETQVQIHFRSSPEEFPCSIVG